MHALKQEKPIGIDRKLSPRKPVFSYTQIIIVLFFFYHKITKRWACVGNYQNLSNENAWSNLAMISARLHQFPFVAMAIIISMTPSFVDMSEELFD